ncbi:MAG: peptidoglycan-binding protein [SAR324 cluster bacterium]|nr:peptidoglycan-binding protein [SAR324 cluster bacterium]
MAVDGIAGPNTLRALETARAPTPPPAEPEPSGAPAPAGAVLRIGSRGAEVRKIQEQLAGLGFYRGPLDGDFGGGTRSAVKVFQRAKGLGADGVVGPNTWRTLFQAEIPEPEILAKRLNERCLALTGTFESNKSHPEYFATLSGDFDGQGISFGVLQWNFGQNSLQKLLGELIADHPALMQDTFQDDYGTLVEALAASKEKLMDFARSIQHPVKHYVHQPWRGMFKALGRSEACQALQVKYAGGLDREALELCEEYGLWSERAAALMFDVKVQNGSIQRAVKARILAEFEELPGNSSREGHEVERMRIVANRRAEASNARWVEDVRARKLCCANGQGTVHGVPFRLAEQFGIGLDPF